MYIKIRKKEVKTCETETGQTKVLHIQYSIGDKKGECNVRDYIDTNKNYKHILKQLKEKIRESYKNSESKTPLQLMDKNG